LVKLSPVAAPSRFERLRTEAGRRTLAIGLAISIEALLLLLFLSLNPDKRPGTDKGKAVVLTFSPDEAEPAPETARPEPQRQAQQPSTALKPEPRQEPLAPPVQAPPVPPTPVLPAPLARPPAPSDTPSPARPARPSGPVYGPPDTRPAPLFPDSQRVGTAPNGEPLYAAAWYREPKDEMLRDYLSTASGPGWGLIACRTAPDYRVEDCVGLAEYPEGSQIVRSILAAAWEFKVRPPRLGGQSLVGAWVRIRIDYQRR
jgi:protein TonB